MNAIAGAAILAERFGDSKGGAGEPAAVPAGALPIFHWINVQPLAGPNQVDESPWPPESSGS
jgi:hypothetical protein